jgi:hypothetical protein
MLGGGIYFCSNKRTLNKCIIEAMLRPDTVINPLTFSSMAGFIFTLHRPGGLIDANGDIFIRSDNIGVSGKKKIRAGSGGVVVSTLVIKIVMKQNDPNDADLDNLELVLPTDPGYDSDDPDNEIGKSSLEASEITVEQKNHNELYQTFHLGEKMVPSLVGDLIELDELDIQEMITAIQQKANTAKRAKVIRVFEYFASQIIAHKTSVVMMFMEMVGDDTRSKSTGDNTYKVTSSLTNDTLTVAAARGAGAIQLLCMRKMKKQLVDAHEGNWFIDEENKDNVRAIDFGRVVDITDKDMILEEIWKYKRSRQSAFRMKTGQGTFLSKITSKAYLEPLYDRFIGLFTQTDQLPFLVENEPSSRNSRIVDRFVDSHGLSTESKSKLMVRRNIHFCLVFASLIDNAITSNSYPDWDQPQMIWAYEEIWGVNIVPDKDKKQPIHHIHTLDFDYDTFKANMKAANISCRRANKSYDEIARLILLYSAVPVGSAAKINITLGDAMTRKKKTAVARGITATNIGEFVSFHDVYHAHSPVAGNKPSRIRCAILGGSSKYGNNSMNSKTRRNRRNQLTTYSFSH